MHLPVAATLKKKKKTLTDCCIVIQWNTYNKRAHLKQHANTWPEWAELTLWEEKNCVFCFDNREKNDNTFLRLKEKVNGRQTVVKGFLSFLRPLFIFKLVYSFFLSLLSFFLSFSFLPFRVMRDPWWSAGDGVWSISFSVGQRRKKKGFSGYLMTTWRVWVGHRGASSSLVITMAFYGEGVSVGCWIFLVSGELKEVGDGDEWSRRWRWKK